LAELPVPTSIARAKSIVLKSLTAVICGLALGVFVPAAAAVDVWITSGDRTSLLSQKVDALFDPGAGEGGVRIDVRPDHTYQTIDGFGAAMTDSSAWVLTHLLNTRQRRTLMRTLFSPDQGIGISYLRVPMGASDFSASGRYSYNDLPAGQTDPDQTHFSIDHDRAYILPELREARVFNPALRLMATPWSAPGWMKTSGSMIGGSLAPQWSASYALYFQKFIQAYAAEGLPIDTLSLQNEPLYVPGDYPGMGMSASQQADLIRNHFGPLFASAGIDTKILAYDHNWDVPGYPLEVLGDPQANQYVAGSAFHGYGGNVAAQSDVADAYPDKGIYFTEFSGGDWAPDFADNLVAFAENQFIGGTRNYAKNVLLWNLALDENHGPHDGGCTNCRGVVTVNSATGAVTFNEEFYSIAHASKFVQPGAVRISSSTQAGVLDAVAFRNPDDSEVLLSVNPTNQMQTLRVVWEGEHFAYNVPAKSLATFVWHDTGADFDNGGFEEGGYETTGGSLDAWQTWGNASNNVTASDTLALEGDHSLRLARSGQAGSDSGAFQGMTVKPGDVVRAAASVLVRAGESFAGSEDAVQMKVEFYSTFGAAHDSAALLGESASVVADATTTLGTWQLHELKLIAPANTVEARLVLAFDNNSNGAGAAFLDATQFEALARLPGDYNADGRVDAADYTAWRDELGQSGGALSADGSGPVPGVPDGVVDQFDYEFWKANFGASVDGGLAGQATVPEPTAGALALLVILMLWPFCRVT
jgi:glucosylceramidase